MNAFGIPRGLKSSPTEIILLFQFGFWDDNILLTEKKKMQTGGYSPIKVTEVLDGKFREHSYKVPESCFINVFQIHFQP